MLTERRTASRSRLAIALVVVIILAQSLLSSVGFEALASMRAYVTGESIYSKAQKDALLHLLLYVDEPSVDEFRRYEEALAIAQADNRARVELERETPDLEAVRRHFQAGNNAEEDIHRLIWLFRIGRHEPHFARAVALWEKAEGQLAVVSAIANTARAQLREDVPLDAATLRRQVAKINEDLTRIERDFSNEIGAGARFLERVLLILNMVSVVLLLLLGYRYIIRSIQAQAAQNLEFGGLLQTMSEAVIVLDDRDAVVSMNVAAERLLGCNPLGCVGTKAADLFQREDGGTTAWGTGTTNEVVLLSVAAERACREATLLQGSLQRFTANGLRRATLVLRPLGQAEQALVNERRRHQMAEQELLQKALSDPLTGLLNREALTRHYATLLSIATQTETEFVLLLLDLDGFKAVNDQQGHLAGDAVLVRIANAFRNTLRTTDQLFRLGGDEFVAVLSGDVGSTRVDNAIARLRQAAQQPIDLGEAQVRLSVSIGQAVFSVDGDDLEELLRVADRRMYQDKQRMRDLAP